MTETHRIRTLILEKAMEKFFAHGYSGVSMDEIAGELGMSKKTLYKHFPAKAQLLEEGTRNFIQAVIDEQDRILQNEAYDFDRRFSELMKILAKIVSRMSPSFLRDIQRSAPGIWKIIEETRQKRIHMVFGGLLSEGQAEGFVRKELHVPFVVHFIAAIIRETMNPSIVSQFPISILEAFETLRTILLGGVLTHVGRERFLTIPRFSMENERQG